MNSLTVKNYRMVNGCGRTIIFFFSATACQDPYGLGMNTVIVLDTSESMRGEGISQAMEAIERLLSGKNTWVKIRKVV